MTFTSRSQQIRVFSILVPLACFFAARPAALVAQVSPEEHEQHHPEQTKGADSDNGRATMGTGGMMGGEMGGMMNSMMEKMGAPKPKDLYPKLMSLPDLPIEQRAKIQQEAHQRMLDGSQLLSAGLDELTMAAAKDDFPLMQTATAKMREGLSQFESGLGAKRAIVEGKAPRNVALQWFKREMNLQAGTNKDAPFLFFGMTPFHTSIMAVLLAFAVAMIWMYFLKMQRAAVLMERLAAVDSPTAMNTAANLAHDSMPSTPVVSLPAKTEAENSSAGTDCCEEAAATCGSADTTKQRPDISTGILRVAKRKLCRLRVASIFQETPDVKTFRLIACHGGALPFNYLPGQFLTVTLPIGEKPIRRSYTISSSPTQGYYCEITVKREDQGAGSRYLHDCVKEADTLEVQAPSGKFIFTGNESESVVLIGGGVGITPMMSITRALTDMAYPGDIDLVVACRDSEHFIYEAELRRLQQRHPNLHVFVAMSRLEAPLPDIHAGRLSQELIEQWIPNIAAKWIQLCGAPTMMEATKQMLRNLGVSPDRIHTENFGSQQKPQAKLAKRKQSSKHTPGRPVVTASFSSSSKSTQLLPDETLLEAAERIEVDIEYSCRTGTCGVCAVRLLSGEAVMDVEDGLDPEDKARGMVLACQARSTRDVTVEA